MIERGSNKTHRKKSQSQLYWSNPVFPRALLDSFFIFISMTLYFHLAQFVIVISLSIRYFLPDENEGHFPFCSLQKFPTSPLCANGVARPCLGQQHSGLSDVFKMETGKSHTVKRFSGLEVYCLLNQMTQIDKDCDTYNEYISIYGPELGRYCFSSNSDVGFDENVAESIQGKKEFANSGCYKSKKVNMFIIFIPL